jgi:hypothetical protein
LPELKECPELRCCNNTLPLPDTTVYGLSRRPAESSGSIRHISVDLLSPSEVKAKLGLQSFDNVSSTIKVRQDGFHECLDSETMFSKFFEKFREMKRLPAGMRENS